MTQVVCDLFQYLKFISLASLIFQGLILIHEIFCCCNFKLQVSRQTEALLKQDKEYLNKQLQELRGRCTLAEERLEQMSQQLGETKQAREELYEKYISVREQYKSEYELRLKSELDDIKGKTSLELDRIRGDTKDMFERENR